MRVPLSLTASMAGYLTRKSITGAQKFPLVMMLEPLHACNLTCTGCGRIREYKSTINEMLTVEQCLKAVDECGAPIVSICGGEPMIYPEIGRLSNEILARKKHIYLCTNGMFIRKHLRDFTPTSRLFFNVHLDGLEKTHDICVERDGVFREAIEGIKAAAWGNPTYNPRGWKGPCYLMTDAHHDNFKDFIEQTPWEKYGRGRDPRCEDCMVHAGYEASAVLGGNKKLGDTWKMLSWTVSGKMGGLLGEPTERERRTNGPGNGHSNDGSGNGSVPKRVIPVAPAQQGDEVFRIL
jgi:hypothetical protein